MAVCLKIDSPGQSPLTPGQSVLLAEGIRDFSSKQGIPVYAFVEDVATSGGYFLAFGAEKIYAKESSIVKKIGVKQTLGLQVCDVGPIGGYHRPLFKLMLN